VRDPGKEAVVSDDGGVGVPKAGEAVPTQAEIDRALRRAWFPVARSQDLDRPRSATLLGEDLVVFRTESGVPAVLSSRCPHRGANLALGEVEGEAIACPYHGWRWRGADGRCTLIPAIGEREVTPSKAVVRTYPSQEQWGLVWCSLEEPVFDLPELPELEGLDLTILNSEPIPQLAGIGAATENFRDVAHFPFVHRASMGEIPQTVEPTKVRREGMEVWTTRRYAEEGGTEEAPYWDDWSEGGAVEMRYHTIAPALSVIVFEYERLGTRALINAPSPIGREECLIYFVVANDAGYRGPSPERTLELETQLYLEDKVILDSLRPREIPWHGEAVEFSVSSDRYSLAYRKAFLEFVRVANAARDAAVIA
jgi:phenylpropionate dioxygenase-like ring-hydroxylating dioxygenase large terminal subunit